MVLIMHRTSHGLRQCAWSLARAGELGINSRQSRGEGRAGIREDQGSLETCRHWAHRPSKKRSQGLEMRESQWRKGNKGDFDKHLGFRSRSRGRDEWMLL